MLKTWISRCQINLIDDCRWMLENCMPLAEVCVVFKTSNKTHCLEPLKYTPLKTLINMAFSGLLSCPYGQE